MVGHIKDITGSTTPALYIIASLCVVCIALLIWATPKRLKEKVKRFTHAQSQLVGWSMSAVNMKMI